MRISSADGKAWIDVARNEEDDFPSFTFGCAVDIGHGVFKANNSSLSFLNMEEFA